MIFMLNLYYKKGDVITISFQRKVTLVRGDIES